MMKIKLVSELKGGAVALVLPLLVAPVVKAASAQEHVTISELPEEPILQAPPPKPTAQKPLADGDQYFATAGAFCGTGASTSRVQTIPTVGCGLGVTLVPLPIFFEFGVMTPQANRSYLTGYISVAAFPCTSQLQPICRWPSSGTAACSRPVTLSTTDWRSRFRGPESTRTLAIVCGSNSGTTGRLQIRRSTT